MKLRSIGLPTQIILGLLLGIFSGFFFGELVAPLQRLGSAFIMLLKMSILPYMSFSLIHAIGELSPEQGRRLAVKGALALVIVWVATLITVYAVGMMFPEGESAQFHSETLHSHSETENLLQLFIPINPFHALANDIVPAVVLFSLFFGLALMHAKSKAPLLENLKIAIGALTTITRWVTRLSPIGVFALVAVSVGTTPLHQIEKIELYIIGYWFGLGVLSLIFFPLFIASITPISSRAFMQYMRPAILLAFTTGNVLVSLPLIVTGLENLLKDSGMGGNEKDNAVETMVPIAYNFPTVGNLFCLLFILFMSFFYAKSFSLMQHVKMLGTGMTVLFGAGASVINGISFLIDALQLPIDGLGLFLETMPLVRNMQTLSSTIGIAVVSLLTVVFLKGAQRIRLGKLAGLVLLSSLLLTAGVLAVKWSEIGTQGTKEVFSGLSLLHPGKAQLFRPGEAVPPPDLREGESSLGRIQRSGVIRIGYRGDIPPFSYFNKKGDLVGYDIAFAHDLAKVMGVEIHFIPFSYRNLEKDLLSHRFDIAMSSVSVTPERLRRIRFSDPYLTMERALIVKDHRRKEFADSERLTKRDDLKIAVMDGSSFIPLAKELFPLAQLTILKNKADFIDSDADAMFWGEAGGTTWALMHPDYTAVIPGPSLGKEFYAFAMAPDDDGLADRVNYWLDLKKLDGFEEQQRLYWVQGELPVTEPRWSIIRDVLHWID